MRAIHLTAKSPRAPRIIENANVLWWWRRQNGLQTIQKLKMFEILQLLQLMLLLQHGFDGGSERAIC